MLEQQWIDFENSANFENKETKLALIVDSPWIPGFLDISHIDYFRYFDVWYKANCQIYDVFPEIIFVPGFWFEYGMVVEPSGFGGKITWQNNSTPNIKPANPSFPKGLSDIKAPNPSKDGLMPFVLKSYEKLQDKLYKSRHKVKIVAARGPLAIASWVVGLSNLMRGIKKEPEKVISLLELTTLTSIRWLEAQVRIFPEVEGILLLDDIVGFISPEDCERFAFPFMDNIFSEFKDYLKIYHNDMKINSILDQLFDLDFEVFNFSYELDALETYKISDGRVALMGNVPPNDVLAQGSPSLVKNTSEEVLEKMQKKKGFILSAGGGVAPGTTRDNIEALVELIKS